MVEINLAQSPAEEATQLVLDAFDAKNKRGKMAHRILSYVLHLAEQRNYPHATEFKHYFSDADKYSAPQTQRWLKELFEFVSADEMVEFAKPLR